jgi:hypothetical protein
MMRLMKDDLVTPVGGGPVDDGTVAHRHCCIPRKTYMDSDK